MAEILLAPSSGGTLTEDVARYLLNHHAGALPDLSGLIVLVPNRRAGQDLARALARVAGLPALIPPVITPLKVWAETVTEPGTEPQSRRLARLHGVLRRETWLGNVDKWALTQELLALADELSAARLGGEIAGRIRALNADAPDRETALIEAVWLTLNNDGTDPQARYASALDMLAQTAEKPLYGYALGPLTPVEKRFLERYAETAPVTLFALATHSGDGLSLTLHTAWKLDTPPIKARAYGLASAYPTSPLHGRLKACAAPHLEAVARAVVSWVAEQLQAGRRKIALVALDRETARRTRALLERMDVLVEDETGWTLSTTAAAAVIDRWMECVARDFPHLALLDLLKSPFLLGDAAARQDPVLALELAMRKHGVSQGMAELRRLARNHATDALPWLDTLADAARNFPQSRASLSVWLMRLSDSLAQLDAIAPLYGDAAGASVLATLDALRRELADDGEKYSFSEWRRWLNLAMESASFVDTGVTSTIVLTSLPAARGRTFEAVAVIGADARHLPARPAPGLFSQSARAQLGLPTDAEYATQTTDDLMQLLMQGASLLSWQSWNEDEPNPASPLITRLQTLHQAAWGCSIETQTIAVPPAQDSPQPAPARQPAPRVPPDRLPRRYSPTAYQTLVDCPYRFFARHVLGLGELDEADDALDKSDYGTALHRILKRFHDASPPAERESASSLLSEFSAAEFANLPAYTAAAWRIQWAAIQPAYIDAWLASVAEGWQYQSGETLFETPLDVPVLGAITLHGRIDRIDRKGDAVQVIDYKTSSADSLKKKLKDPGENVQLPFYAYLSEAAAAYLPINEDKLAPLALDGEADVEAITLRLAMLLEAIAQGSSLPAQGVDAVCKRCEARGLCRRGMW